MNVDVLKGKPRLWLKMGERPPYAGYRFSECLTSITPCHGPKSIRSMPTHGHASHQLAQAERCRGQDTITGSSLQWAHEFAHHEHLRVAETADVYCVRRTGVF